jgi:tetratricopeptide (TPR) repeat protein
VAVTAAIVAILALVGGASGAAWEARAARREATKATRISEFLQGILGAGVVSFGSSNRLPQGNLTLREMLDSAVRRLPVELAHEPLVRAQLYRVIGGSYHSSFDPLHARVQFDSALAIHTRELGHDDIEVARDLVMKGLTVGYVKPDSGEQIVRQALEIFRRQRVADTLPEFQFALLVLAELQLYRVDVAGVDSTVHRLIASEQRRPKPRREVLGFANGQLGANLRNAGKVDSAEIVMRRGIALFDSSGIGPSYEEAVHLFALGSLLASRQKSVDALAVLRRAREMATRAIPPSHSIHIQIRAATADALSATGDTATAHREIRAALAMIPSLAKGTEVFGFLVEWRYASMLRREKLWPEAEQVARRQQASAVATASAFPQYIVDADALLAEVLSDRGKYAEAEKHMLAAYNVAKEKLGDGNVRTTIVRRELARLYLRWGHERKAESFLALLRAVTADSVRRDVAAEADRPPSIH